MSDEFLGGNRGIMLTDTSLMGLALVIDMEGVADIRCNVDRAEAAAWLRAVADSLTEENNDEK